MSKNTLIQLNVALRGGAALFLGILALLTLVSFVGALARGRGGQLDTWLLSFILGGLSAGGAYYFGKT
ncbi:hypothetical protein ACFL2T_02840, partial [Elusimicrobiota bacterium]